MRNEGIEGDMEWAPLFTRGYRPRSGRQRAVGKERVRVLQNFIFTNSFKKRAIANQHINNLNYVFLEVCNTLSPDPESAICNGCPHFQGFIVFRPCNRNTKQRSKFENFHKNTMKNLVESKKRANFALAKGKQPRCRTCHPVPMVS